MKRTALCCIASLAILLGSCVDSNSDNSEDSSRKYDESKYFSFKTSNAVRLHISYGELNAYAQVALFSGDVAFDSDGNPAEGSMVIFSGMLDEKGDLNTTFTKPLDLNEFQLYCNGIYAPQVQKCEAALDHVIYVSNPYLSDDTSKRNRVVTRTASNLQLFPIDEANGFYSLVKWEPKDDDYYKYGYFDDVNEVFFTAKYNKSFTDLSKAFFYGLTNRIATQTDSDGNTIEKDGVLLSNKQFVRNSDVVNINIKNEGSDADGTIHTVQDAEVEITFLFENATYLDVVGYYYYPSDNVPSSPDQVKKIILAPTMSQRNQVPYFGCAANERWRCFSQNAPISQNTTIQLLYQDEAGNVTTKFPAGYTIGFFGIPDGFNVPYHKGPDDGLTFNNFKGNDYKFWRTTQKADNGKTFYPVMEGPSQIATQGGVKRLFHLKETAGKTTRNHIECISQTPRFTNQEWNKDLCLGNEKQPYWVCFNVNNEKLLFGFEDGFDESYDDCIFYITASPNYALNTEGLPEAPYVNNYIPANKSKYNYWANGTIDYQQTGININGYSSTIPTTWAFEDCWPNQGDYDINDVIIEHRQLVQVDMSGKVWDVSDFYEVVQPDGSATYVNAFGVNLNSVSNVVPTSIHIYDTSIKEQSKVQKVANSVYDETSASGTYILFTDCNNEKNKIIRVYRKFNGTITRDQLDKEDQNPFIIPHFVGKGVGNRTEVHLPKHEPTPLINQSLVGSNYDAYFVDKFGKCPYAIEIPIAFVPSTEQTCISNFYPKFAYWVKADGLSYCDWYRSHK